MTQLWPLLKRKGQQEFDEAQKEIYKLEKATNFRWIAKSRLAKRSSYVLSAKDLAPEGLCEELAQIGQFAEIVHGYNRLNMIWRELDALTRPDFPLELYDALADSVLLSVIHGQSANLQAFLAYRKTAKQFVIAVSGTSNLTQALYDMNAIQVRYHATVNDQRRGSAKVHAGFWKLYRGLRRDVLEALSVALQGYPDAREISFTGHSLGAAMSIYLVMDLLNPTSFPEKDLNLLHTLVLKLVLFGSPRVGNMAFAEIYRAAVRRYREVNGADKFIEYSIKAYNDAKGVPTLPPYAIGYRHLITPSYYLYHGHLYAVPPSESECSDFRVAPDEGASGAVPPLHPLGGHNYYNRRDQEKLARRMAWIDVTKNDTLAEEWEAKYRRKLGEEMAKLAGQRRTNRE